MEPAKRVSLIITELEVGGAEKFVVELACRLDRKRSDPELVVLAGPPRRRRLVERLQQAGITVHFLGLSRWADLPRVLFKLVRHFRRRRPDVVQTFLFHANLLGRLAARLAGVPRVVCGLRVAEKEHHWHLICDALTSRWVDQYVCVSRSVARFAAHSGMLSIERLKIIPNAVDVEVIKSTPAVSPQVFFPLPGPKAGQSFDAESGSVRLNQTVCRPDEFWMVSVGRLVPQKGFDWLIATLAPLLKQFADMRLLIVGDGPQESLLRRAVERLQLTRQIVLSGYREDAIAFVKGADLFLLSSRWEGMPNALLEAMAAAKPVVALDAEGVREVLGPLSEHQLVQPRDEQGFRRAVLWHYFHSEESRDLGHQNQQHVLRSFSWDAVVRDYEHLWKHVVST